MSEALMLAIIFIGTVSVSHSIWSLHQSGHLRAFLKINPLFHFYICSIIFCFVAEGTRSLWQ